MRVIDLANPAPPFIHILGLGAPKSGKTHFAATAPNALFISDAAEGGYATIASMDPALWWDPAKPPTVWAVENILQDVPPLLTKLEQLKAAGDFPYQTIVIDPLSIYADRYVAEAMQRAAMDPKGNKDNRAIYGDLANHLRALVLRVHALPAHVIWLCHVKDGGLAISGQTAEKLPAYMDYIWLFENTPGTGHALYTAPRGAYTMLGGRYTWQNSQGKRYGLPPQLVPSFKAVAQCAKLGITPASAAMPGFPDGADYQWPPEE